MFLPDFISGRANPKSSTGRLDIFTRLITDYAAKFEDVQAGYKGKLYAEIAPLTFDVIVREGSRLNQLRLSRGSPRSSDTMLQRDARNGIDCVFAGCLADRADDRGGAATVDRSRRRPMRATSSATGRCTIPPPIDLAKINYYDPKEFWEPIRRNAKKTIVLEAGEFYILASKQKVSIPPDYAAEMIPYDPSVGEFRIHYAGILRSRFRVGRAGEAGNARGARSPFARRAVVARRRANRLPPGIRTAACAAEPALWNRNRLLLLLAAARAE